MTTCPSGLGLLGVCVLSFAFPFFFSMSTDSNDIVHAHGFTMQDTKCTIHRYYNHFILKKKILKMGLTALFTHLKIILLQCFQFSVFSKISCIRMDPTYFENLTIDYMFFIFLAHMPGFVIIRYYLLYDAENYFLYIILKYKNLRVKQLIDGIIVDLSESLQAWRI